MKDLTFLSASLLLAVVASAQDNHIDGPFLCIADMATGFVYENDKWKIAIFNISDSRHIVRRTKPDDYRQEVPWVWGKFGERLLHGFCETDVNENGTLFCRGAGQEFKLNVRTLRYQISYSLGYVDGLDSPADAPYIAIGKCSSL